MLGLGVLLLWCCLKASSKRPCLRYMAPRLSQSWPSNWMVSAVLSERCTSASPCRNFSAASSERRCSRNCTPSLLRVWACSRRLVGLSQEANARQTIAIKINECKCVFMTFSFCHRKNNQKKRLSRGMRLTTGPCPYFFGLSLSVYAGYQ